MDMNKVILLWRIWTDIDYKEPSENFKVANFSLATNKKYTKRDWEKVEETVWHNIVLYNGQASVANNYAKKWDKVLIEWELKTRTYQLDWEAKPRYVVEIIGSNIILLWSSKWWDDFDTWPDEELAF